MIEEKVVVSKKRDFSDVLNVAFAFIRQEYKKMGRMLLIYAGIPVLVQAILATLFLNSTMSTILGNINNPEVANEFVSQIPVKVILLVLIFVVVQVLLTGMTYCYVVLYKEKGADNFEINEVWDRFTGLFLSIIGFNILSVIIIFFAAFMLFFPAIYIAVPLSLILIVKVAENNGYGDSFSRCFYLVRSHWWQTFGLVIVTVLIVYAIGQVFNIPARLVGGMGGILVEDFSFSKLPMLLIMIFSTVGNALLAPLSPLVVSFQYFSLVEHKDNTSLLDKIDKINEAPNSEDE
ncbi:hypothetical protein [Labilibacter marinus]|uniref:hypothetical protein n=1 Tax=Labilibacter marinus TaxID=1477105 RepID=UPI0008314E42|nr:hypothetical protein [Labilibacter marinus]